MHNRGRMQYWWRLCSLLWIGVAHNTRAWFISSSLQQLHDAERAVYWKTAIVVMGTTVLKATRISNWCCSSMSHSYAFKSPSLFLSASTLPLCASSQHFIAMTGQLILTLSPSTTMTARAAGSRSLALHALVRARNDVWVCTYTHDGVDCWDRRH